MTDFLEMKCDACNKKTPRVPYAQAQKLLKDLPEWHITSGEGYLRRRWEFKNFADSLKFVLAISKLAEEEGHHPDINFGWGYVEITLWTHAIDDLSVNDFILATKINLLPL